MTAHIYQFPAPRVPSPPLQLVASQPVRSGWRVAGVLATWVLLLAVTWGAIGWAAMAAWSSLGSEGPRAETFTPREVPYVAPEWPRGRTPLVPYVAPVLAGLPSSCVGPCPAAVYLI